MAVAEAVAVAVAVEAAVEAAVGGGGGGGPPQLGNLKEPIRVRQLKVPLAGMYSVVYQNVQSSLGSTLMLE